MPEILPFVQRLLSDMQEAGDNNYQINIYTPGAVITGSVIEFDDNVVVLGFSGGMSGKTTKVVIDIDAINAYTVNAQ